MGTGSGWYVGPNQIVAQGTRDQATVVAFQLGTCSGQLMYRAVEWYFPDHGGQFDPSHYEGHLQRLVLPAVAMRRDQGRGHPTHWIASLAQPASYGPEPAPPLTT